MQARPYLQSIKYETPEISEEEKDYPFTLPLFGQTQILDFHPSVTFFVGENGTGKSTLIEGIAQALGFSSEGGTKNVYFSTTEKNRSQLAETLKLTRSFKRPTDSYFLRAESFFNVATYMEQDGRGTESYGVSSLHEQSHGEAFMSVLVNKLRGKGLYIFDEPEAALSPMRQLAALAAMHELVCAESQFIIATHSPILLSYPDSKIIQFQQDGTLKEVTYEQTDHFSVTKDFLVNYKRRLEQLLDNDNIAAEDEEC